MPAPTIAISRPSARAASGSVAAAANVPAPRKNVRREKRLPKGVFTEGSDPDICREERVEGEFLSDEARLRVIVPASVRIE